MFVLGVGEFNAALCLVLLAAILFYWSGRRERRLLTRMPGPYRYPLIGCALELMRPIDDLKNLAFEWDKLYGPVKYIESCGVKRVMLTSPESIQMILSNKNNLTKDSSYNFIKPWLGTGLLTCAGNKWRPRRRMVDPAFHYNILEGFVPVFNANSAILVTKLRQHITEEYVEINDYISLCMLDIICETAMGTSIQAQSGQGVDYVKAVKRMGRLFIVRHMSFWLHPEWIYQLTSHGREQKKTVKLLQDFSGTVIQKKRSENEARKKSTDEENTRSSLLDMLMEMSDQTEKLTDDDIREEVNTFMFAGHDTSAAAISWALFLLGVHQDIQEKVVSELMDIFGSDQRMPTMADFQKMTYMDQVIKEVLRLYPSVPIISRILDTDVTVGEYTIPAGINVMMLPFVLHRNADLYPDPERFDPERFSPEQRYGRHPYAYIPFSAGPRNCIGQKFARFVVMSVLSTIFRNFKLESLDDEKNISIKPDIILKPAKPFKIKLSSRV